MKPQMNADERGLGELTERIIGCAFTVSNSMGCGFLEKVYENALAHELRKAGVQVEQQPRLSVSYDGTVVGEYVADMLLNGQVLIEVKATKLLDDIHLAQCMNYLRASGLKLCLLMNFGAPKGAIRRVVNNL